MSYMSTMNGIFKNGSEIRDLEDWHLRAGPKSDRQWKDGRSAKESANAWLSSDGIPAELLSLLEGHPHIGRIEEWMAEPEATVRIDDFSGEPPNIDVLVKARDQIGPIAIIVEAKADEPFGRTIEETLKKAKQRLKTTPNSKGVERLERLSLAFFDRASDDKALAKLRYQLFTASGAALAEAQRMGADRAVVLIHEFVTSETEASKRQKNYQDFLDFIVALNPCADADNKLVGPIIVPGQSLVSSAVKLYFGKATMDVRSARS